MRFTSISSACLLLLICCQSSLGAEFFALGKITGGTDLSPDRQQRFEGLSGDGSTVVGTFGLGEYHEDLFRWTRETGTVDLGIQALRARSTYDGRGVLSWDAVADDLGRSLLVTPWTESGGVGQTTRFDPSLPFQVSLVSQGNIIVGSFYWNPHWFTWDPETGLGPILPGRVSSTTFDGNTVVGQDEAGELFRWDRATGFSDFLPAGSRGTAFISADGSTIAGVLRTQNDVGNVMETPYRWTESHGFEELDQARDGGEFGVLEFGLRMSADGRVIYGSRGPNSATTVSSGLRWRADLGWETLETPPVTDTTSDGKTAVARLAIPGPDPPSTTYLSFVLRDGRPTVTVPEYLTEVGLGDRIHGWTFDEARIEISDDGLAMAGHATNPVGLREAWYADLRSVPEPQSPLQMIVATVIVGSRIWRIRRRGSTTTGDG